MTNNIDKISLLEDRVTKFGGTVFPKFGWCCILAGGAGSGKGYNFTHYVPIEGRRFDPDRVKELTINKLRVVDTDMDAKLVYTDGNGEEQSIDLDAAGVKPPYNTTNPQYTGLLHTIARPLTKKLKNLIFKGTGASRDRLPNVIFDCTMSDIGDYEVIIPQMKSLGYKIAVVYVFTKIDVAIAQNKERGSQTSVDKSGKPKYGRRVDYKTLLDTHDGFYKTLAQLARRPDIIKEIDDIWAIISSRFSQPQIISIKEGDKLDFSNVNDFLMSNSEEIAKLQREYDFSGEDNGFYNEGQIVIGAYDLYEALNELKDIEEE